MTTQQDKFAAALLARGEKEIASGSRKFRIFTRTMGSGVTRYFLGKAGSVRAGVTRKVSIPVAARFKAKLLEEYTVATGSYKATPDPADDERHPDSTYEQGGT